MHLITGGYGQGKLRYALSHYGAEGATIWEGNSELDLPDAEGCVIMNHFHAFVKRNPKGYDFSGQELPEDLKRLAAKENVIIICDEIGSGVVPVDADERRWREDTGNICILLSGSAESVERVICGIGQKLK